MIMFDAKTNNRETSEYIKSYNKSRANISLKLYIYIPDLSSG